MHRNRRFDEYNAEAQAKGKKGSGKAIGRSTMDDGLSKIVDFGGKLMIGGENLRFWQTMGALGCFRKLLGRLWGTKWPLESTILAP